MHGREARALVCALAGCRRRRRDPRPILDLAERTLMTVDRHSAPINFSTVDGEPVLVGIWPDITRFAAGFLDLADPKWVSVDDDHVTIRTKATTAVYRKVHSTDRGDWVCRKVSAT
jgi:hypothetical protein